MAACLTQADLVDDFESYTTGDIEGQGGWTYEVAGSALGTVASDAGNQYVTFGDASGDWRNLHRPLGTSISTKTTLFFRIYAEGETTIDYAFGLTDDEAIDWYDDLGAYCRLTNSSGGAGTVELSIRNGGSFVDDLAYLNVGQWYNIWLVVDPTNGSGTSDLYYAEDGAVPTAPVYENAAFRKSYVNPLDNFVLYSGTGTSAQYVRVDDIYVIDGEYLEIPISGFPYAPGVEEGTPSGTSIPATLKWKAAGDPDGVYEINPNIVDQYVFISSGSDTDPNLYYKGATAVDESGWSLTDPNSEYTFTASLDSTYSWVVVEALDGYTQALTTGDSIALIDPNNIVGPTWTYESKKSTPTISTQPVDARVFTTDPNAVFTVTFTSPVNPVTATWYKNDVALTGSETDVTIETSPYAYSRLSIETPELADEDKYYCVLSVDENSTADDLQTATRLVIIKQLLAQFDFEDDLADSSTNGAPSGQGKYVDSLDPNELEAANVTLTYVEDGVEGKAVSLTEGQYIDFGTEGYPKAGPLDTLGDARGEGYEKQGFGRGMEQGSILCWVKLTSTGAVYMNANGADNTHFGLTSPSETSARMIMRGSNWDDSYQELGAASGSLDKGEFSLQDGHWHMFAATWDDSGVRTYINGEQVASASAGVPEIYTAWERSNLLGASRTAGARHILNSLMTGAVDSLRIYNYVISADDIATEYLTKNDQGYVPCMNHDFTGSEYNLDDTGSSYCKVDIADLAVFADVWLANGYFTAP